MRKRTLALRHFSGKILGQSDLTGSNFICLSSQQDEDHDIQENQQLFGITVQENQQLFGINAQRGLGKVFVLPHKLRHWLRSNEHDLCNWPGKRAERRVRRAA